MQKHFFAIAVLAFFLGLTRGVSAQTSTSRYIYEVRKINQHLKIDGNWDKRAWKKAKALDINNFIDRGPLKFHPVTHAKMMYDKDNLYVIFRVQDQYVKSLLQDYNASVYQDACVEFFFSPDLEKPERYFHIETNTSGKPFFAYDSVMRKDILFKIEELKQIEIFCSLPPKVDPEITEPLTWTIEYRIPLSILRSYAKITQPAPGVQWNGNFYKTASKTSNPHWVSWSLVDMPNANFHQPDFFGRLIFK